MRIAHNSSPALTVPYSDLEKGDVFRFAYCRDRGENYLMRTDEEGYVYLSDGTVVGGHDIDPDREVVLIPGSFVREK